jgi:FKBP-type peptidyl-prolyl cis-trans isomerase FkpA
VKKYLLLIFSLVFFASCGSDPFPGFTGTSDSFFYKLRSFGDKERKVKEGDVIYADVASFDAEGRLTDTLPGDIGRIIFVAKKGFPRTGNVIFELSEGDSATIMSPDGKFGKGVRTEMRILKVQTQDEYDAEQKHIAEVGDIEEHKKLEEYISENKISVQPIENGLYIIPLQKGKGDTVHGGKTVQVSYKGYFLDGRQFDGTKPGQPLEFVYGTDMQVIDGLSKAIGRMQEGDKSKIIIPSHLAFGEKGSSTGVVPPFTTLIYEVEIVKVK